MSSGRATAQLGFGGGGDMALLLSAALMSARRRERVRTPAADVVASPRYRTQPQGDRERARRLRQLARQGKTLTPAGNGPVEGPR